MPTLHYGDAYNTEGGAGNEIRLRRFLQNPSMLWLIFYFRWGKLCRSHLVSYFDECLLRVVQVLADEQIPECDQNWYNQVKESKRLVSSYDRGRNSRAPQREALHAHTTLVLTFLDCCFLSARMPALQGSGSAAGAGAGSNTAPRVVVVASACGQCAAALKLLAL